MAKAIKAIQEREEVNNDPSSKIEAIKNLIFGDNMNDISLKKKELEDYIEDARKELNQAIDNLGTDINIRITELEDNLANKAEMLDAKKVDKKSLGDLLISLGEKISK